ncbi:MAG: glycosyltransferase family 2 protein [Crocinitomicaceae bacterium]
MKLSVIIVNYNVAYFLEQCLNSTYKALEKVSGEVFVVDNNSIDGSVEMVQQKFPNVHLIANHDNPGFSVANNQAIEIANGEYVLLLNPDTVVEEDTFQQVIEFMDDHQDAGGLGVKMIDGKGVFLPESKRGLPTPRVAFYKIFGLSRLFPKSKRFGKYHLSYLDRDEVHSIDVLSGAFMLMRKKALDKVGLLDETFFMYGEDIDLSYRLILGGYKNYYYPKTRIIHYKGESTKKSSVNYVFVFYNAMIIFAKKHFSQKNAKLFSFLINIAIYFRAGLALLSRLVKRLLLPFIDYSILLTGLFLITYFYETIKEMTFPQVVINWSLPIYTLIWIVSQLFSGGYDKPVKLIKHVLGGLVGTGLILVAYALLAKDFQFSRLIILLGGTFVILYYLLSRLLLHKIGGERYKIGGKNQVNLVVVGDEDETERVKNILLQSNTLVKSILFLSPNEEKINEHYVGTFNQLDQVIDIHHINEVIFCAKNVSAESTINQMMRLDSKQLDFKISQPESAYVIGSSTIDAKDDLYMMDINQIDKPANVRNKRFIDILLSVLFILLSPILLWFFKSKGIFLNNMFQIFFGKKSFVGYTQVKHSESLKLPKIKRGILSPAALLLKPNESADVIARMNLIYAKNHSVLTDLKIIKKSLSKLDQ